MTATIKLYELAQARDILDGFLVESEGEVTPELQELLDGLAGDINEKIERVALYIREQLATAEAVKAEEQRLAARRKSIERGAEGLKGYLKSQMERLGTTKVNGLLATVAIQHNPPSVKGDLSQEKMAELHALGLAFIKHIPASYALDRNAALKGWKADGELPYGLTVEQGTSLRIR